MSSSLGLGWSSCVGYDRVAVAPDGKIVISGYFADTSGSSCDQTVIARFNRDGTTDTSFGDGSGPAGTLVLGDLPLQALAVQPDGKLLAAGYRLGVDPGGGAQIVLRRYQANGYPDVAFGVDGEATLDRTAAGDPLDDRATSLVIQPWDGKILVGGLSGRGVWVYDWEEWLIARFTTLGELDPTFGGGAGFLAGPGPGASWWQTSAVAVDPDGMILVHIMNMEIATGGVIRLTSDAEADIAFGTTGIAPTPTQFWVRSMSVDAASGRIALAGAQKHCIGADMDWAVHVFTSSGAADTNFNTTGHACRADGYAAGAFFQDDGRLVVGGGMTEPFGSSTYAPVVVRYLSDGSADPELAGDGVPVDFGSPTSFEDVARWGQKVIGVARLGVDKGLARLQLAQVAVDPPVALRAGSAIHLTGGGVTPGTRLKVFLATSSGALDVVYDGLAPSSTGTADWHGTLPYPWPLPAPFSTFLGNGFVALQFVRTDQGYSVSPLVGSLLLGNASLGIPSLESLAGEAISPSSTDLSIATANVETVVPRNAELVIRGEGFASPVVNVFTASGNIGPLTPSSATSTSLFVMIPPSAPIGPGSFQIVNKTNWRVSNAVSAPIGEPITVTAAHQLAGEDPIIEVIGTGFNALTVINLFATVGHRVENVGGLQPDGTPKIPLDVVDSHHFTFRRPTGLAAGAAYVQALNPPFIPFTSSGSGSGGRFTLP